MTEQQILERFWDKPNPCIRTLGGRVVSYDPATDICVMEWNATQDHCHSVEHPRGGIVQGGFVTGWLDAAMAHACMAKSRFTVTVPSLEIKVSFLLAAHPGRYLAYGSVVRWGRTVAFLEGELKDEAGALIAKASSTVALRPMKPAETGAGAGGNAG